MNKMYFAVQNSMEIFRLSHNKWGRIWDFRSQTPDDAVNSIYQTFLATFFTKKSSICATFYNKRNSTGRAAEWYLIGRNLMLHPLSHCIWQPCKTIEQMHLAGIQMQLTKEQHENHPQKQNVLNFGERIFCFQMVLTGSSKSCRALSTPLLWGNFKLGSLFSCFVISLLFS